MSKYIVARFITIPATSALWVWTLFMARCTRFNIYYYVMKLVSDLLWFSQDSYTNKTECKDIPEILLKVALNTTALASLTNIKYTQQCRKYLSSMIINFVNLNPWCIHKKLILKYKVFLVHTCTYWKLIYFPLVESRLVNLYDNIYTVHCTSRLMIQVKWSWANPFVVTLDLSNKNLIK